MQIIREKRMLDRDKPALEVIKSLAREIGYGEQKINLIIYDGKIVGFDRADPPVIKFRSKVT